MPHLDVQCSIEKMSNGIDALIVQIIGDERLGYGNESDKVVLGITYDELNNLYARKVYIK